MSVPHGQPQAAQQPGPTSSPGGGLGLSKILAIVAGGLGLLLYLLSFGADAGAYLRGLYGVLLLGGGLLAAASALPKAPATLVPAAVSVVTGTLFLLVDVFKGPAFLDPAGEAVQTPGLAVAAVVLAFLQSAACVAAVLMEAGVVTMAASRRSLFPQRSWTPQQPGGYPGGPGQGAYPGGPGSGGYLGGPGSGAYPGGPGQGAYPGGPGQGGYPGGPGSGGYPGGPGQGAYPGGPGQAAYPGGPVYPGAQGYGAGPAAGGHPGGPGYSGGYPGAPAAGGYPAAPVPSGGYPAGSSAGEPSAESPPPPPQPYPTQTVQYRPLSDQDSGQSTQYGGEPDQLGGKPGQHGGEPDQHGAEPAQDDSEPEQRGGRSGTPPGGLGTSPH